MPVQVANNFRIRRSFGRIKKIIDLPYLIEIQKNSYELFLQKDVSPTQRQNLGLRRGNILLQKKLVGIFLNLDQIREINDFLDSSKTAANPKIIGYLNWHSCSYYLSGRVNVCRPPCTRARAVSTR